MKLRKIYIRVIDGTEVFMPVEAEFIKDNLFKIIKNEDMDLEGDATCIYEFFPGDTVKCEIKKDFYAPASNKTTSHLLATELISSTFPNRKLYQLIFIIVKSFGKIPAHELRDFRKEIKQLCEDTSIMQRNHPSVEAWITNNCL